MSLRFWECFEIEKKGFNFLDYFLGKVKHNQMKKYYFSNCFYIFLE